MNVPTMLSPQAVAPETTMLPATLPVPGFGLLPVNAFVIRGAEPVLIDTGLAALRKDFIAALDSIIEPAALRWIYLTHVDADHSGNLEAVLSAAPQARVVTTFLGMGKLGLAGLPLERVYLLNPGQSLALPDRRLTALRPPSFDAPETTGVLDERTGALFSSDCFGALLQSPAERADAVPAAELRDGSVLWATVDAPWLAGIDARTLAASAGRIRALSPSTVLSSHLPPAPNMLDMLIAHLVSASSAPVFEGPDQAALEAAHGRAA